MLRRVPARIIAPGLASSAHLYVLERIVASVTTTMDYALQYGSSLLIFVAEKAKKSTFFVAFHSVVQTACWEKVHPKFWGQHRTIYPMKRRTPSKNVRLSEDITPKAHIQNMVHRINIINIYREFFLIHRINQSVLILNIGFF